MLYILYYIVLSSSDRSKSLLQEKDFLAKDFTKYGQELVLV